jgi:glycosyltransferase involved in cell wall biosynthesis
MKNTSPLFTVIIPCKDRAQFLYHTLRTCMIQNYEPLDIVVSDDGSTDHTRDVVEDAARLDSRVRYVTPGAGAGMLENFEYALRQTKPGFVIALGGDDGILPNGIRNMNMVLQETGTELLAWPAPIYIYPHVRGAKGQLSMVRKRGAKIVKSHDFLARQATNLHYLSDTESPMFYVKGVASTRIIERVRSRTANRHFYSCPTPDGYSGIVLAGEVSQYAFSDKPFSIFGLSPTSQGLAYLSNSDSGKKISKQFYKNVADRPMHPQLASQPYSPLITLMTVDYLLTARELPGWPGKFPPIDFHQVLTNGLSELTHGLYGEDRIRRELSILNNIAEHHNLGHIFRKKVKSSRRRKPKMPFEGSGISPNALFFDADAYQIHNIFDAAYAAHHIHQFNSDLRLSSLIKNVIRSLSYAYKNFGKGDLFPPEEEWRDVVL